MAYAAPATVTLTTISGRRYAIVSIAETEAATASEWSVQLPFRVCTLVKYEVTITAGTGVTVNPILGRAAAFAASTQDHISTQTATAIHIHDTTHLEIALGTTRTIYGRSTVNAGADNTIATEMVFAEGIV